MRIQVEPLLPLEKVAVKQSVATALGMAQDTGLIVAWHKSQGDAVAADDVLFEVETDKATMEVPSPAAGVVKDIRVAEGDKVSKGSLILVLETASGAVSAGIEPASPRIRAMIHKSLSMDAVSAAITKVTRTRQEKENALRPFREFI